MNGGKEMLLKRLGKIGIVDVSEISFDDPIEISIEITKLSDKLLSDVIGEIEYRIQQGCRDWELVKEQTGHTWGKVDVAPSLLIRLFPSGAIEYKVVAFFQDEEHEELFDTVYFDVDIPGHEDELKACLILGLLNKFCNQKNLAISENRRGVKNFK